MVSAAVQPAAASGAAPAIRRRRYGGTKLHLAELSVDVMVLAYRPPTDASKGPEAGPQDGPQVSRLDANRSSSGSGGGGTVTSKA